MVDLDFKSKDIEKFNISSEDITRKIKLISSDESSDSDFCKNDNLAEEQIKKAQARLQRLEKFNHELKDLDEQKLNHFESEPAYKRSGIELDNIEDSSSENPISRLTLDEGDTECKENNSFLHDNVD